MGLPSMMRVTFAYIYLSELTHLRPGRPTQEEFSGTSRPEHGGGDPPPRKAAPQTAFEGGPGQSALFIYAWVSTLQILMFYNFHNPGNMQQSLLASPTTL